MRFALVLRQVRAIRPVEGRKDGILTVGGEPALSQTLRGDGHAPRGLMAIHAGTAVRAQWRKEGMPAGFHGSRSLDHPQLSEGVIELIEGGENFLAAWFDPRDPQIVPILRGQR